MISLSQGSPGKWHDFGYKKSPVILYDYFFDCSLNDAQCEHYGTLDGESYCFLYGKYLKPFSFRVKL
jgi:hypothetical protein